MKTFAALIILVFGICFAGGEIVEKNVTYELGETKLKGFHDFAAQIEGKRPGVLIIHQWTGLSDYEKKRARMLAELGYNVFAADVYGAGIRPQRCRLVAGSPPS